MKIIFENKDVTITDTEMGYVIVKNKGCGLQMEVSFGPGFIKASACNNRRIVDSTQFASYLEVRPV